MNMTVSIVVPVFNAQKCIADTIMSVLAQTYEEFELLLEQVKTLNAFAKDAETPEQREQVFAGLWEKAQPKVAADGVNEHWQQDAREELSDLAQGAVRSEQQGMKR